MQKIGLWQIIDGVSPNKIQESSVDLEQYLESWIETDPDLLQLGLTIIGRQVKVEGGIIDLLAMDSIGRLVVIEVKRGMLRRETIAQIIDYASSIATMSKEELFKIIDDYLVNHGNSLQNLLEERRTQELFDSESKELLLFVVGTGKAPGLERMVSYLSDKFQMPISLVSFDVFELKDGQQILAREITEPNVPNIMYTESISIDQLYQQADQEGIGKEFRALYEVAVKNKLYPRLYKHSIMYTPPNNKTRMLYTVWTKCVTNGMKGYVSPKAFAEFYPVSEEKALEMFGKEGWRELDEAQTNLLVNQLDTFFSGMWLDDEDNKRNP